MDVSENNGTPKSSILIGFSTINHPFWGNLNFGNTHIQKQTSQKKIQVLGGPRYSWELHTYIPGTCECPLFLKVGNPSKQGLHRTETSPLKRQIHNRVQKSDTKRKTRHEDGFARA